MQSWRGQVVVVTGASLGIGAETARALAGYGARLVLSARDAERLSSVAAECRVAGAEVEIVVADVTIEAECRTLVDRAVARFGQIDTLICNAGQAMWARAEDVTDWSVFERLVRVNYLGAVYCSLAALPRLRASRGRLVVVSSLAGKTGVPMRSGYAAAKAALHGFFDSLRIELRGTGVTGSRARNLGVNGELRGRSPVDEAAMMPVAECTRQLLGAAARRDRELVMTGRARLGMMLKLLLPGLVDRMAERAMRNGR
ncbi:MAG: SDR family oxidoreductase [Gemmatimonadetes bacterium]|nr:SDR family oxidoreductase [Gemmatimonadota bacterium]